jgi:signal transduction histidine kinase
VESGAGVDEPRPAEPDGQAGPRQREQDLRARETALDARAAEQREKDELQVRRGRSQDRREQRQQQRSELQDTRQAEQDERDRFRDLFVGVLGHDLRNPLSAITLGAAALLKGGTLGEKEAKGVARIARSADRMTRMIHQLLDFTRTRLGGGMPIERRACDLNEIVRQVIEEAESGHPGRSIHVREASNPTGSWTGSWDRDRLSQLLSNLVRNALEHGSPGTPVGIYLKDDPTQVEIVVENQGPVIPSDLVPVLFDPFRQGERRSSGGLGLGLYIAQQIARGHGGDIDVTSSDEEGTRFSVKVPR